MHTTLEKVTSHTRTIRSCRKSYIPLDAIAEMIDVDLNDFYKLLRRMGITAVEHPTDPTHCLEIVIATHVIDNALAEKEFNTLFIFHAHA